MKTEILSIAVTRNHGDDFRDLVIREGFATGVKVTHREAFDRMLAWYRDLVEAKERDNPEASAL